MELGRPRAVAIELVDAIWIEIPDFRESYELRDGLLRTKPPERRAVRNGPTIRHSISSDSGEPPITANNTYYVAMTIVAVG